jgi:hypothetical protein
MSIDNNNITFSLDEEEIDNKNPSDNVVSDILEQIDNLEFDQYSNLDYSFYKTVDLQFPQMVNYNENYTVKQLLHICDYYGISRELKAKKCTKEVIIQFLVDFESKAVNAEIVCKRHNMWFYMNELKKDKFMKKYIIIHL